MAANQIEAPPLTYVLEIDPRPSILFRRARDGTISKTSHRNGAFLAAQVAGTIPEDFVPRVRVLITSDIRAPVTFDIADLRFLVIPVTDDWILFCFSGLPSLPALNETTLSPPGVIRRSARAGDDKSVDLPTSLVVEDGSEPWRAPAEALGWFKFTSQLTVHQKRVASFPWETTSLGPIPDWPASLKLAVAASILNPAPRCIYWGPNFVAIYNEACIPLFGAKHPEALGAHPSDVWSETWPVAAHMFNDAMYNGKATQVTNLQLSVYRHGFLEEIFIDSVYLPIPGFDNKVKNHNGILHQFTETTDTMLAERHQKVVNAIFTQAEITTSVQDFLYATIQSMRASEHDVAYALLYLRKDVNTYYVKDETEKDDEFVLAQNIGFDGVVDGTHTNAAFEYDTDRPSPVAEALIAAAEKDGILLLRTKDNTLPAVLRRATPNRGFGDIVTDAVVIPITTLTERDHIASLIIGMNPRRSMDSRQMTFAQVVRDALIRGATVVSLPNETRRNQKRIEQINASLLDRLQESAAESTRLQARFEKMAGAAPHGMFMFTPDGRKPIYVNDEYLSLLNMTREALDDEGGFLKSIADEDVMRVAGIFQKLISEFKPVSVKFRTKADWEILDETTGRRISAPRYLVATCLPETDELGNVLNLQGWLQDVSEAHYTQSLLSQRLQEATVSRQNAESFIDMVSHELRNPLSAILQSADSITSSQADILAETSGKEGAHSIADRETADAVLDAAQTIILCAQHQKRIVDDILTLSKLDSNLLMISPDIADPTELLQKALKMFEAQLEQADITAVVDNSTSVREMGISHVMMDSSRVLQIVINMLTNSIKFTANMDTRTIHLGLTASKTPPTTAMGVGPADVRYIPVRDNKPRDDYLDSDRKKEDDMYLTFYVKDSGKGLTSDEMAMLFQKFSQASPKTYGTYGGSGLGLFISRELTELQGGQIGVSSEAGHGSTFAFYIRTQRCLPPPGIDTITTSTLALGTLKSPSLRSRRSSVRSATLSVDPNAPAPASAVRRVSTAQAATVLDILIVEDNIINQRVMAKQIRAAGHRTYVANHGLEALEFIRRTTFCAHLAPPSTEPDYLSAGAQSAQSHQAATTPFPPSSHQRSLPSLKSDQTSSSAPQQGSTDSTGPLTMSVILMDLEMPILDGLACVRQIRHMQASGEIRGHVPVIAVTANARSEQISIALEAGMDEVVTKPFLIREVLQRAAELVGGAQGALGSAS